VKAHNPLPVLSSLVALNYQEKLGVVSCIASFDETINNELSIDDLYKSLTMSVENNWVWIGINAIGQPCEVMCWYDLSYIFPIDNVALVNDAIEFYKTHNEYLGGELVFLHSKPFKDTCINAKPSNDNNLYRFSHGKNECQFL